MEESDLYLISFSNGLARKWRGNTREFHANRARSRRAFLSSRPRIFSIIFWLLISGSFIFFGLGVVSDPHPPSPPPLLRPSPSFRSPKNPVTSSERRRESELHPNSSYINRGGELERRRVLESSGSLEVLDRF